MIEVRTASGVVQDGPTGENQDEDDELYSGSEAEESDGEDTPMPAAPIPRLVAEEEERRRGAQTAPEQRRSHRSLIRDAIAPLAALAEQFRTAPVQQQQQQQDLSNLGYAVKNISCAFYAVILNLCLKDDDHPDAPA